MAAPGLLTKRPIKSYSYNKNGIYDYSIDARKLSFSGKRKSAVELLQESKANYVKSEAVLDSQQQLKNVDHLRISPGTTFDLLLKTRAPEVKRQNHFYETRNDQLNYDGRSRHSTFSLGCCNDFVCSRNSCRSTPTRNQDFTSYKIVYNTYHPKSKNSDIFCRAHDIRRSHHERFSNDVQNKLRKLLNTDSKENINYDSPIDPTCVSGLKNFHKSVENLQVPCEPFIKPRHEQECNYALHKSMPDLSPNKLEISSHEYPSDSEDESSMVVRPPKSIDGRRLLNSASSRKTTSDYASRSPSSKLDYSDFCDTTTTQIEEVTALQSQTKSENPIDNEESMTKKPILRSKSDVSYRYLKESEEYEYFESRRASDTVEVEVFFDCIGLGPCAFDSLTRYDSAGSSPVFFDVDSSDDSFSSPCRRRSLGTQNRRPGLRVWDVEKQAGVCESSIVEKNARVVKWLFACRKAQMTKLSV